MKSSRFTQSGTEASTSRSDRWARNFRSLAGNVVDTTGAVVVGATVRALNVGTNVAREATTDARGSFLFSDLLPGVYDVTVEAQGFGTQAHKAVRVDSNTVRRVDTKLDVSAVAETIEITAAAAPLQTDRADVHVTQSAREVNDLPISGSLGRNYQSLINLVPGATPARFQNSTGSSPARALTSNVNGVNRNNNVTKVDGAASIFIWLIKTLVDYRRWLRLTKIQTEAHTKLLDRLTSNDDLRAYIQSPSGRRFPFPSVLEIRRATGSPVPAAPLPSASRDLCW